MLKRGGVLSFTVSVIVTVILMSALAAVVIHSHQINRREAGPLREVGKFDAGAIVVREVVGNVSIVRANVSGVIVKSNLPLNVSYSGDTLTVRCQIKNVTKILGHRETNACNEYKDGEVLIEVGRELAELEVRETVGDVSVNVNATKLVFEDVVGDLSAVAPGEYRIEGVVGDVSLHAERDVTINDVVGDVDVLLPDSFSVQLSVDDIVGSVKNTHTGEGTPVVVKISDVIGDVRVE
jgi:hypothetical protein